MSARTLLWLAALVLALLALWQGLRAFQLSRGPAPDRRRAAVKPAQAVTEQSAEKEIAEEGGDDDADFDYGVSLRNPAATGAPATAAGAGAAAVTPDGELFAAQLELRQLQRELAAQQQLVGELRQEIERLNSELSLLQQALTENREPAQASTSPEYAEPLRLAELGFKDEEIAARCGITLAEARLVLAMAQRGGRG